MEVRVYLQALAALLRGWVAPQNRFCEITKSPVGTEPTVSWSPTTHLVSVASYGHSCCTHLYKHGYCTYLYRVTQSISS